jgi:hypothetical protein
MQSVTPEYLDRQRQRLKRSRLFEDATYAGKPLRAQSQIADIEVDVGGQGRITQSIQAIVDWVDLDAEPVEGDVLVYTRSGQSFEVVEYRLQGDGMCRLFLNRRQP